LQTIRELAVKVSATQPQFKVLGLAISSKVMALHVALSFPNWDPKTPLPEADKVLMSELSKKTFPHITVSLAHGASAVESNRLLEALQPNKDSPTLRKETTYGDSMYIPLRDTDITVTGEIQAKEYSYQK
jgi:recombination DNA repair RAD52 pathway protein